jgi:hypothetical protein
MVRSLIVTVIALGAVTLALAAPSSESASILAVRQAPETPPKEGCHPHADHYDCDDGGFCELEGAEWICFDGSGQVATAGHEDHGHGQDEPAQSSSSTCVVHGGHTHGDW